MGPLWASTGQLGSVGLSHSHIKEILLDLVTLQTLSLCLSPFPVLAQGIGRGAYTPELHLFTSLFPTSLLSPRVDGNCSNAVFQLLF